MAGKKLIINYVDQVVALLTGDEDKAIALKNARKANAAVKGQISALEGKLVDAEDNLQEAIEAAELAKYPTKLIGSGADNSRRYVENLFTTDFAVSENQDEIDDLNENIAFLKAFLKEHKF